MAFVTRVNTTQPVTNVINALTDYTATRQHRSTTPTSANVSNYTLLFFGVATHFI